MKKLLAFVFAVAFLFGCAKDGERANGVVQHGGDDFCVELLFELDGVKIYRFLDGGYARYFSVGNGNFQPQTQRRTTSNGKATIIHTWEDGAQSR